MSTTGQPTPHQPNAEPGSARMRLALLLGSLLTKYDLPYQDGLAVLGGLVTQAAY